MTATIAMTALREMVMVELRFRIGRPPNACSGGKLAARANYFFACEVLLLCASADDFLAVSQQLLALVDFSCAAE